MARLPSRIPARLIAVLSCMIAVLYPVVPNAQTASAAQVAAPSDPATTAPATPFGDAAIDDDAALIRDRDTIASAYLSDLSPA